MSSPSTSIGILASRSIRGIGLVVFSCLVTAARPTEAANVVSFVDSAPFPPVSGVVLPAIPITGDRIVYRRSLGRTFTNACFPEGYGGPPSVTVDIANRIVRLDFDETAATANPFCSDVFLPVSSLQLELDPLPAGNWTLEVDRMMSAVPIFSIAPHTVPFTVSPAAGAAVPTGSARALLALLGGALCIASSAIRRRS